MGSFVTEVEAFYDIAVELLHCECWRNCSLSAALHESWPLLWRVKGRGCDNDHLPYTMLAGRIHELHPSLTCALLGRTTLDNAEMMAFSVGINGKTQACDACTNYQCGNACVSITVHLWGRFDFALITVAVAGP